jgi:hypothetical protein
MKGNWLKLAVAAVAAFGFGSVGPAEAGPLCSTLSGLTLATFDRCVVDGDNDDLPSVQAALNGVLDPDVILNGALSFSPGPESAGDEFDGDDAANNFDVDIDAPEFTFVSLPPNTLFVTIKQGNAYEIFNVDFQGGLPFTVEHQLNDSENAAFSHFSTFAANRVDDGGDDGVDVPAPSVLILVGLGVTCLAARRRAGRRQQ